MNSIKNSYPNGICPDCNEPINDDVENGDECPNCGHVYWEEETVIHLEQPFNPPHQKMLTLNDLML